jgi:hypothetical protein
MILGNESFGTLTLLWVFCDLLSEKDTLFLNRLPLVKEELAGLRKRLASFFTYPALSHSVAFARLSGSVGLQNINLCSFISDVEINTTGAADVIIHSPSHSMISGKTSLIISLFCPIALVILTSTLSGNNPIPSVCLVAWPGFPAVNC